MQPFRAILAASVLLLLGAGPASQPVESTGESLERFLNWGDSSISLAAPETQPGPAPETRPAAYVEPSDVPSSLYLLLRTQDVTATVFVCPDTNPSPRTNEILRSALITLSDGRVLKGLIYSPTDELHILTGHGDNAGEIFAHDLRAIDVDVVSERLEQVHGGGGTFPVRLMKYTLLMYGGSKIWCGLSSPIYVDAGGQFEEYKLPNRQDGKIGQAMKEMIFIKSIRFSD